MTKTHRKHRTRAHIIADLSVNHVERHVLQCGWTVQRFNPDYGLDVMMTTFNRRGEIENGDVRFQLKATDSPKEIRSGKAIAVRLDWRDVIYWLNEPLPVILVLYDAKADRAWWLHLQQALRANLRQPRAMVAGTLTASVPLTNTLNVAAVRAFRKLRNAAVARLRG